MTNDNETLARRFYEPLTSGNTHTLDDVLAPKWEGVPSLRSGAGPDGWKRSIDSLRGVLSDLTVRLDLVVASGDLVAVRSTGRGKHTGSLLGVDGTGKAIEFAAADFHQIADGRIVRTWHLEDYFGIARQLGLQFQHDA